MPNDGHYSSYGKPKVRHQTRYLAECAAAWLMHDTGLRYDIYFCRRTQCHSWHVGRRRFFNRNPHSEWDIHELGERAAGCFKVENHGFAADRRRHVCKRIKSIYKRLGRYDLIAA